MLWNGPVGTFYWVNIKWCVEWNEMKFRFNVTDRVGMVWILMILVNYVMMMHGLYQQGHFTAFQDLNTCNHLFDPILKKQTTNKHWSHALETSENLPRNVIVQPLKLTRQLSAFHGLPESAAVSCVWEVSAWNMIGLMALRNVGVDCLYIYLVVWTYFSETCTLWTLSYTHWAPSLYQRKYTATTIGVPVRYDLKSWIIAP
jgi:hypothetical protein